MENGVDEESIEKYMRDCHKLTVKLKVKVTETCNVLQCSWDSEGQ